MENPNIVYLALIPYAAVALAILASLVLFLSVKRDVHRTMRRERKRVDEMLDRLQEASTPAMQHAEPVFLPTAPQPGFNIHRRVQALRLLRRGETASHISAALGVPQKEVDLLVRVQELVAKAPPPPAAAAAAAQAGGD